MSDYANSTTIDEVSSDGALSVRAANYANNLALSMARRGRRSEPPTGYRVTVGDVRAAEDGDLLRVPNIGRVILAELRAVLGPHDPTAGYSPTDVTTWTRDQLIAELEARMGLRAPEGWVWGRQPHTWRCVWSNDDMLVYAHNEGVEWRAAGEWGDCALLTGPAGAFAAAEAAASTTNTGA